MLAEAGGFTDLLVETLNLPNCDVLPYHDHALGGANPPTESGRSDESQLLEPLLDIKW